MSPDQRFLVRVIRALDAEHLEAILVGNAAAVVQGAPVMTEDLDFFVRDTPRNHKKIAGAMQRLSRDAVLQTNRPVTSSIRVRGLDAPVDFIFTLGGRRRFESVRSRAMPSPFGPGRVRIASLQDIIAAKKAANRPKDRAAIPLLEETLKLKRETRAV